MLTEEVRLDQLPVRVSRAWSNDIGAAFRDSLDLRQYQEQFFDRMVFELQGYVLAEKLVEKRIEKRAFWRLDTPTSWWQAFKDEVLDRYRLTRWFVRWRPVKWTINSYEERLVADFTQYATFPAADIRMPEKYHKSIVVAQEFLTYD